jgi:hypothetical protein
LSAEKHLCLVVEDVHTHQACSFQVQLHVDSRRRLIIDGAS